MIEPTKPKTFEKAVSGPFEQHWKQAIQEELDAYQANASWEIVKYPGDVKLLNVVWVFKIKRESSNKITSFKARLCTRGCNQREDIDYHFTYTPVVRYDSLRILFVLTAELNLELMQFDVKTFLYGDLEEVIYVKIPKDLNVPDKKNNVCLLKKAVYGLKQASRICIK